MFFTLDTGNLYNAIPRLQECCRQVETEEVSNSMNKIHQTWERPYRDSLYICTKVKTHCLHQNSPPEPLPADRRQGEADHGTQARAATHAQWRQEENRGRAEDGGEAVP